MKFQENDIRPVKLLSAQKECLKKDIQWLLEQQKDFVLASCPACQKKMSTLLFQKNSFQYQQCDHCDTFYMSPRPTTDILHQFYHQSANYNYWNTYIYPQAEEVRRKKIFVPRVKRVVDLCQKFNPTASSILEIGAGFGIFCEEVSKENTFSRVVAIEPTPDLANTCRDKGLEVIELPIEEISTDERFDVIVSFEVIEHLFSPLDFIRHCKKLLKKNGILIITCPNGKGFDIQILKTLSTAIDHQHLNYFNPTSLSLLLEEKGLQVIDIQTPGFLDAELVRNKVLSGEVSLEKQPFLQTVLMDKWEEVGESFQTFLRENMLSSHMMITAIKY